MQNKNKKLAGAMKNTAELGIEPDAELLIRENWTPLNGGTSIGIWQDEKSDGIEIRGCKNTSRGKRARGPMA